MLILFSDDTRNPSAAERIVQAWEGVLTCILNGQTVTITRLTGHLSLTASESLAKDWPSTMLIERLLPEDFFNMYHGRKDEVFFNPQDQHAVLEKLFTDKLWAVIRLLSQVLAVLTPVKQEAKYQMIGMLLSRDALVEDLSRYFQN